VWKMYDERGGSFLHSVRACGFLKCGSWCESMNESRRFERGYLVLLPSLSLFKVCDV
jgi:hypothetical protein